MTNIMRNLLTQKPVSFNVLLDLYEAYLATIDEPLTKGCDLIREEFDYTQGDIFGHICGVRHDSSRMAQHIQRIRFERNHGRDVTLPPRDASLVSFAIKEASQVIADAATIFDLLRTRALADDANEDCEAMAIMSLAYKALAQSADYDVGTLRRFAETLAKAGSYAQAEKPVAAEPVEVEVVA